MTYGLSVTLDLPYETAVAEVRAALKEQGSRRTAPIPLSTTSRLGHGIVRRFARRTGAPRRACGR